MPYYNRDPKRDHNFDIHPYIYIYLRGICRDIHRQGKVLRVDTIIPGCPSHLLTAAGKFRCSFKIHCIYCPKPQVPTIESQGFSECSRSGGSFSSSLISAANRHPDSPVPTELIHSPSDTPLIALSYAL